MSCDNYVPNDEFDFQLTKVIIYSQILNSKNSYLIASEFWRAMYFQIFKLKIHIKQRRVKICLKSDNYYDDNNHNHHNPSWYIYNHDHQLLYTSPNSGQNLSSLIIIQN